MTTHGRGKPVQHGVSMQRCAARPNVRCSLLQATPLKVMSTIAFRLVCIVLHDPDLTYKIHSKPG
jgi:hypothetical protein